jgi:ketosteroid isomerase-like protein
MNTSRSIGKTECTMTEQRIWDFVAAWSRRDIDALMTFIAEDCVYVTTTGPDPGTTYIGKEQVRQGFLAVLSGDDEVGAASQFGPLFICDNNGVLEWSSTYKDSTGNSIFLRGCDLLAFEGDLIVRKDAFRKVLP